MAGMKQNKDLLLCSFRWLCILWGVAAFSGEERQGSEGTVGEVWEKV